MIVQKKRRTFWQWLADKANLQARLDREERDKWLESGMRIMAAMLTKKPTQMNFHQYGEMVDEYVSRAMPLIRQVLNEQASGAMERIKDERSVNLARALPVQPVPEPQTADVVIKPPVKSVRQIAAAHVPTQIFPPDSLSRMIGTNHIPAIAKKGATGVLLGMQIAKHRRPDDDAHKSGHGRQA